MDIDFTVLFNAVIAVAAALITHRLIPYIKSNTTESQYAILETAAKMAAGAAEQIYKHGDNKSKLDYAMKKVTDFLANEGIKVDLPVVRVAVESAVNEMKLNMFGEEVLETTETYRVRPLSDWSLDMLRNFFDDNNIPHEGCETKEDYIKILTEK